MANQTTICVTNNIISIFFGSFNLPCSRLVRQEHVKEDQNRAAAAAMIADQRSPSKRTFVDAKQALYDDSPTRYMPEPMYNDTMYNDNSFLEVDEEETGNECNSYDLNPYQPNHYHNTNEAKVRYDEIDQSIGQDGGHSICSVEGLMNESQLDYGHVDDSARYSRRERPFRRRRSREITEIEVLVSSNDEDPKWKPEAMRSVSEDGPQRNIKPLPRRSLSHPEQDTQVNIFESK